MRYTTTFVLLAVSLFAAAPVGADQPLDCGKQSLAAAVSSAREKDPPITFTGVCVGPVLITTDGVTLQGAGVAIIDGGGQDNGAGVTLVNSTITGNSAGDIQLTFAARADLRTLQFGTASCDATVLVRGTSTLTCPR